MKDFKQAAEGTEAERLWAKLAAARGALSTVADHLSQTVGLSMDVRVLVNTTLNETKCDPPAAAYRDEAQVQFIFDERTVYLLRRACSEAVRCSGRFSKADVARLVQLSEHVFLSAYMIGAHKMTRTLDWKRKIAIEPATGLPPVHLRKKRGAK